MFYSDSANCGCSHLSFDCGEPNTGINLDNNTAISSGWQQPEAVIGCYNGNNMVYSQEIGEAYINKKENTKDSYGKETHPCYTFSGSVNIKEEKEMSFVGISYVDGKVFAFADSKSSRVENGTILEDYIRPVVNKIFSNHKFIAVMYGRNTMEIGDAGNTTEVYLEDIIPEIVGENDSFWEAMVKFKNYINDNLRRSFSDFSFVGGYWITSHGQKTFVFANCTINKDKIIFQESCKKPNEADCRFAGDTRYVRHYERYSYKLLTSNMDYLEKELIDTITMFGRNKEEYNPVGGPVNIVEFRQ